VILIVSHAGDAHLALVTDRLNALDADWCLLNTDDYPERVRISNDAAGGVLTLADGRRIATSEITAVWWRRPRRPVIRGRDEAVGRWAENQAFAALDSLLQSIEARWVNYPRDNRVAEDKPANLRRAAASGFEVPDWCVTNDPEVAHDFHRRAGDIVAKPVDAARVTDQRSVWTRRVESPEWLDAIGPEPYLLQRFIDKVEDVRVTVVGDEVFAVAIESQTDARSAVDLRAGDLSALPHRQVELLAEVVDSTRSLARSLNLAFAAVDLVLDHDGRHWFVELNPNGQWAWLEAQAGAPIGEAIARALT
jgi:glutathione synthase/RimK-type ligase-like ATP-grasp enzyme